MTARSPTALIDGGAVPLLADRLEMFRSAFAGALAAVLGSSDAPTVQAQLRRLWFDMAGTPFPNQIPALVKERRTRASAVVAGRSGGRSPARAGSD